jgi:hypothetical protein
MMSGHRRDRRVRRAAAPVLVVCLVALLSSCSSGIQSEPASQILSTAVAAAHSAGTFHFVDREGSGSQTRLLTGDASAIAAQQTLSSKDVQLNAALVGGVAFIRAGSSTLSSLLGLSTTMASQESGKWVSVSKGEKGYVQIVQSLEPEAELDGYIPESPLGVGKQTTIHGVAVIPVSGTAPAGDSSSGLPVVATLFVSTSSPYLPVGGALSGKDVHGRLQKDEVVFTKWGETVHVSAPGGAVSLASLTG